MTFQDLRKEIKCDTLYKQHPKGGEMKTPEQEYRDLFERMAQLCYEQGWGDPFSYARSKEIYAATVLGHRVAGTFSGADAIGPNGEEYEYKSTIDKRCKGSYTGISVQPTWEEQEDYLRNEKIGKYPKHYYNRFEGGKLVESWEMDAKDVLDTLLPKMKRNYTNTLNKKDPRLSANVCWGEIEDKGRRVI
jgi:hypothetical protein